MQSPPDSIIERCAMIADEAAAELTVILRSPAAKKGRYDRQTMKRLVYAVRWCRRIAMRIRNLADSTAAAQDGLIDLPVEVAAFLRELRPVLATSRGDANWRRQILARLDALLATKPLAEPE